ncbi:hypothetical protein BDZ88DRAFT_509103 [Geranomyces variabilis]|nr:hypothetical protein BDZ88DRAFT_509103 [Geranomyces variabilis]
MPRPTTIHEAAGHSSRPGAPSAAVLPPLMNRHSLHSSALRTRAQLPRFNTTEHFSQDPSASSAFYNHPRTSSAAGPADGGDADFRENSNDDSHIEFARTDTEDDEALATDDEKRDDAGDDGRTLRDVQEAINIKHPFGLRIWKPALYRKFRSIDTKSYKALHAVPGERPERSLYLKPGNVMWGLFFGWWIALVYLLVAIVILGPIALVGKIAATIWFCGSKREPVRLTWTTIVPWFLLELEHVWQYAKVLTNLSGYIFWPFGKFIAKRRIYHMVFEQERDEGSATERTGLMADHDHSTSYPDDTYVVGISDECDPSDSRTNASGREPKFAPHHDNSHDDDASDVSQESWREYLLANRRYSYTSPHDRWANWIPRWVRRTYNAGFAGNIFRLCVLLLIAPLHLVTTCTCSFMVFSLPMAKLNYVLLKHLLRHPLQISAHTPVYPKQASERPSRRQAFQSRASDVWRRSSQMFWRPASIISESSEPVCIPTTLGTPTAMPSGAIAQGPMLAPEFQVILCTYDALGWEYYKYTYDGINIIFINLISVVFFALIDFHIVGPRFGFIGIASPNIIFAASLISAIPLAYFIGMAVASITSETGSLAVGAVINATFGSIIEIILYMLALTEGKPKVVEGAVVGSLLAGLLALPGVSMFFGGMRRKEQRFNAKAAGVTATMLIMAVVGCFTPTLFQEVYGTQELRCHHCPAIDPTAGQMGPAALMYTCTGCRMTSTKPQEDKIYLTSTRYLVYVCAGALILMYAIGLLFTLRTHSKEIYAKPKTKKQKARSRRQRIRNLFSRAAAADNAANVTPAPASALLSGSAAAEATSTPSAHDRKAARASLGVSSHGGTMRARRAPRTSAIDTAGTEYPFPDSAVDESSPHSASPRLRPSSNPSAPMSPSLNPRRSTAVHTTGGVITVQHPDPAAAAALSREQQFGLLDEWDADTQDDSGDEDDEEEAGHHDHPNWGIWKSAIVLLGCTVLYSLVAEVLISSMDDVVEKLGIGEKVLGVTLFSWVPLVTEFYNAIAFAMNNNIALSLEIGSAYVMQAAMLQIPVIIAFSAIYFPMSSVHPHAHSVDASPLQNLYAALSAGPSAASPSPVAAVAEGFSMIFPRWDLYAVFFGTFILTYVYIEGKANYFKGAMLLGAYGVLAGVYFFEPEYE